MNEWRIYKLDRGSIRSNPRPKHDLGNWNILYCWTVLTVVTFINLSFSDIFIMVDIFFWCLRLELGLDNYQRIDPRNWSSKDIPTSWQEKLTMTIMINESDEDHIGRKNFDEREIQICAMGQNDKKKITTTWTIFLNRTLGWGQSLMLPQSFFLQITSSFMANS